MAPGEKTTIKAQFTMTQGMGGPHQFDFHVKSNDAVAPEQTLTMMAEFPRP